MMQPAHGTSRQLQLGDEEQIDERLARRAHELEGRLAKFGSDNKASGTWDSRTALGDGT